MEDRATGNDVFVIVADVVVVVVVVVVAVGTRKAFTQLGGNMNALIRSK